MSDRERQKLMRALLPSAEEQKLMGRAVVKVERGQSWIERLRRSR